MLFGELGTNDGVGGVFGRWIPPDFVAEFADFAGGDLGDVGEGLFCEDVFDGGKGSPVDGKFLVDKCTGNGAKEGGIEEVGFELGGMNMTEEDFVVGDAGVVVARAGFSGLSHGRDSLTR